MDSTPVAGVFPSASAAGRSFTFPLNAYVAASSILRFVPADSPFTALTSGASKSTFSVNVFSSVFGFVASLTSYTFTLYV